MCHHRLPAFPAPAYNVSTPAHVHIHFVETVTITYHVEVDVWT